MTLSVFAAMKTSAGEKKNFSRYNFFFIISVYIIENHRLREAIRSYLGGWEIQPEGIKTQGEHLSYSNTVVTHVPESFLCGKIHYIHYMKNIYVIQFSSISAFLSNLQILIISKNNQQRYITLILILFKIQLDNQSCI